MTQVKLKSLKEVYLRIEALENSSGSSSSAQIDFATPEEVLTAMTTADIVEKPTQEPTE